LRSELLYLALKYHVSCPTPRNEGSLELSEVTERVRNKMHRGLVYIPMALGAAGLIGSLTAVQQYNKIRESLPPVATITNQRPALTTRILSRDGKLIGTLFQENRTWTPLEKISPSLRKAIVAIEDKRFYEHKGVDLNAIARAAVRNFRGGDSQEGASTLTMQLVRNVLNDKKPTYERKVREALMAWELEKNMDKNKILEMYLNQVYFGHGCYGVASASQYYFGKKPAKLTIAEASVLASLPQSPDYLSNPKNLSKLRERQIMVLNSMQEQNMIDERKLRAVVNHNRQFASFHKRARHGGSQVVLKYPYFTSYVIRELSQRYDHRTLYGGGLTIVTTLDTNAQRLAEQSLKEVMDYDGEYYNARQSAMVALDNHTGQIRAMVGGRKWTPKNQFNRAWQAERQAGSTFKAFVYASALENGYKATDIVDDSPTKFSVDGITWWEPQNSDGAFLGKLPLWRALMLSRNLCSANLVADIHPETVLRNVQSLGLGQDVQPNLSIALGAVEVTPLQMASAYSAIANDGYYQTPSAIVSVTDARGKVLEQNRPQARKVLSSSTASSMTTMLQNVVFAGTGTAAALPNEPVAGKTGTSDQCKDAWFVGFTPKWTTAVWVGNDNQDPMWGCYGGTIPARIFHRFMAEAAPDSKQDSFVTSHNQKPTVASVCSVSHQPAGPGCRSAYQAIFDPSDLNERCDGCRKPAPLPIQFASNKSAYPQAKSRASEQHQASRPAAPRQAAQREQDYILWEAPEVASADLQPSSVQTDGTPVYSNVQGAYAFDEAP
jgi:penicillin-binding protein 1A